MPQEVTEESQEKPYSLQQLAEDILAHRVPKYSDLHVFCIRAIATYADCVGKLEVIRTRRNSKIIDELIAKQHLIYHGDESDPE